MPFYIPSGGSLVSLNTAIPWPGMCFPSAAPAVGTLATLDAAGEYESVIYCAREDMTISHVAWRVSTATGSPTADVRIESVATDGMPSGNLWATDTNIVTGALSANTTTAFALTAPATITKGQMFCVKVGYASGTTFIVQFISNAEGYGVGVIPYRVTNTGTPTKAVARGQILSVGNSSTTFYSLPHSYPVNSYASNAYNNTNSAERGLRFQVPFKCRCVGIADWNSTSTGDFNIVLRDDAGAELSSSSTAFDGDQSLNTASGRLFLFFDNPVTLSAGTWYRASKQPSSATNVTIGVFTLPSAAYRTAWPCGANAHYTTFASGSWTDSATDQLPLMDILIDQLVSA